jgi:hypothetical protein
MSGREHPTRLFGMNHHVSSTQVSAYVTLAARKNVLEENGDDPGLASGSIINFQHICTVQPESSRQLKFKQPLLWNTALHTFDMNPP